MEPTTLGLVLSISGGLILGVLYLVLRRQVVKRQEQSARCLNDPDISFNRQECAMGMLLIKEGGKVISMNPEARKWFNLQENESPGIERIAARIRPKDAFFTLCAQEGEARLALEGRLVQARSVQMRVGSLPVQLITMEPFSPQDDLSIQKGFPARAFDVYKEITKQFGKAQDQNEVALALLEAVEFLLPADKVELCILEKDQTQRISYQLTGLPGDPDRILKTGSDEADQDLPLFICQRGLPLLARTPDEIAAFNENGFNFSSRSEYHSFIGIPLKMGNNVLGALIFLAYADGVFSQADLNVLDLIAPQMSFVLHDYLQQKKEGQRSVDLTNLLALTQGLTEQYEARNVFDSLLRMISPLIPVEVLGFLIYDEKKQVLEGKTPFQGLPPQFMELYFAKIPPNLEAEKLLLLQQPVITAQASACEQWEKLGLIHLAQAASLQETALIPLVSSGRMLGYLQASNHKGGEAAFSESELNLLKLAAAQAAPIIENAALLKENVKHTQTTASLRRVANLTSSSASLNDIIRLALREISFSFNADIALMFLLEESSASLTLHPASLLARLNGSPDFSGLGMGDAQFPFSVTGSVSACLSVNCSRDDTLIPYYRDALSKWAIESVVIVPLIVRDEGIGEIWIGSQKTSQFNQTDIQYLSSAAVQIASLIENSRLLAQTDADTQRRLNYFSVLRRIELELSSSADMEYLLQVILDEAIKSTGAERGTILILEPETGKDEKNGRIRSSTGIPRFDPLTGTEIGIVTGGSFKVLDGEALDGVWLPDKRIRSAALVPVQTHQETAGLLALYSRSQNGFDYLMLEFVQSLATQAGIAIGNERLLNGLRQQKANLDQQVSTFTHLFELSSEIQPGKSLDENLQGIAAAISEVTPFQTIDISVYDETNRNLTRVCGYGISNEDGSVLTNHAVDWKTVENLLKPEAREASACFIPAEVGVDTPSDLKIVLLDETRLEAANQDNWQPQDQLLVPLTSTSGCPLGLIRVDAPSTGKRPDRQTLEALSMFGRQAVSILENHRHQIAQTEKIEALETLRNRLRWDLDQARQEAEQLRQESVTQTRDTGRLKHEAAWANAIPAIVSAINAQSSSDGYIDSFSQELMDHFGFRAAIVTKNSAEGPRLLALKGEGQRRGNIEALLGQHNPIRHVYQENQILFVKNVHNDPRWKNNQLLIALEADNILVIPFKSADKVEYAVLLVSEKTSAGVEFAMNQLSSLVRLAEFGLENLQNLESANSRLREMNTLLAFHHKLEELEPQTILDNLLDTVLQIVPAAEGAWVGLWDEKLKQLVPTAARGYPAAGSLLNICFRENFNETGIEENKLSLPLRACLQGERMRVKEVNFPQDYQLKPEDLIHYHTATAGKLPLESLLTVLKRPDHVLGVLVIDHFSGNSEFTAQDEAIAVSLTQQAVLALENARLFVESEKRSSQLQVLTESTGVIASTLQVDELKSLFLKQIGQILPFDTATLWLRDKDSLAIAAAEGFEDQEGLVGLSVLIEDSLLFQEMDHTPQPLLVGDIHQDERFPPLLLHDYLSWLGIPMMAKTELIGIIALEKKESDFYSPDQIRAGMTFATQAALSLSNARLLEESRQRTLDLDQRSRRLTLLNQLSNRLIASLDIKEILHVTLEQLRSALNVARVSAVMIDDDRFILTSEIPNTVELPLSLSKSPLLEHLRKSMGIFITSNIAQENDLQPLAGSYFEPRGVKSVLMIPLETSVNLHGWIWLQTEQVYRFSSAEIDLARTMANQAAIAIQNAALFNETQRLTTDLEKKVAERTKAFQEEYLHNQTLLKMISQLSTSIEISGVLEKTLTILNELLGAEQCFILLSNGSVRMYSTGERLVKPPEAGEGSKTITEDALADWVCLHRAPVVLDDIHQDEQWNFNEKPLYRSVVAVPLILGEQTLGAMFLLHRNTHMFSTQKLDFIEAAARQLSIALNNSQLFELANDQSHRLASMLRDQQIESSRSFAILEAVADGVLVTDAANNITLFNASAEKILGIRAQSITRSSLEELGDALKMSETDWLQTIKRWAKKSRSITDGKDYAQQLDLQDGRIVLVHLAPVILDEAFLGTVSILRDITQEVMVDRLKSDFVANVSHELRTPLTSIKGYADLMLMGASGEMTEEQQKFMHVIRENTRRLNVLVNDLLDISHIDAGQLALSIQPLNLLSLSRSILADIQNRSRSEGKPMEFALEAPENMPLVNADPEKVRQVIMNLVSNGYNYTPENGKVGIRMHTNEREVQVDVLDNGIGISEDSRERIFERFYRGDHPFVLATAGTGLGLTISRILVEMHGGKIWFQSSGIPGEGSIFSFTLPIYSEE